jgi:hypothetical protein
MTPPSRREVKIYATRISLRNRKLDGGDGRERFQESAATCEVEMVVTAGAGRVQRWGEPVEEIRPGDVVWFPPGEKHWHGASPTTAMGR